jgi:hypothetical protein
MPQLRGNEPILGLNNNMPTHVEFNLMFSRLIPSNIHNYIQYQTYPSHLTRGVLDEYPQDRVSIF